LIHTKVGGMAARNRSNLLEESAWTQRVRNFDPSVVTVSVKSGDGNSACYWPAVDGQGVLIAAMAAAARAGWHAALINDHELAVRKRRVDACATRAAESILREFDAPLYVVAGEGPGEQMPGAFAGQRLGRSPIDHQESIWNGIFDYVDGTLLSVLGLPGALALGGLGMGMRSVPDLQAYAILVPQEITDELDITTVPEAHAVTAIDAIMRTCGPATRGELRVVTHSDDTGPFHHNLIRKLQAAGVGHVIVPDPVIIEAPYVLARAGFVSSRIDTIIGVLGFPELMLAALLLDLLAPEFTFVFRVASLNGTRSPAETLAPLFKFSATELADLDRFGWQPGRQYMGSHMVPAGSGRCAVLFAVTDNPLLRLRGPRMRNGLTSVDGLLVERGKVTQIRVMSNGDLAAPPEHL
jgi:fructose-1,6-bisphosphatase/sedoheptulose 1,7-bisphosphatase-like protein